MMPKRTVLIVEDNLLNREILVDILDDRYTVLQAENGQEALDLLKKHGNGIDLILLDVMMPVMDGYTFLDRKKEDAALAPIPVIVTTQSDSEQDEVSALEHGATDFVPKPYRAQVILHRVESLIKLRETAAIVNQFRYDGLTGLYSKEFFYQKVREKLSENPETEYSLICSNIENFKLYNDTFGREAGDRLLKEGAANTRLLVGEEGICGRYGADRFLMLQERERELADRKRFFGEVPSRRPERIENVSLKWGIYEITDRSVPVEQMCDRALLAADSIKGQYNRFFAVYDDALRGKLLREKAITDAMETALAERQFTVYLQPKYSLQGSCMVGAEALVRWNHPEWGFMSPGEFIPLFEKNGFISRLDQYIWDRVLARLHDWQEKGYPLLPVSVNVSRADIFQLHLEDVLPELTRKYGIDPAYLHLEITESAYAEAPDRIIRTAEELRRRGFILEMDDFGSGYSSLNMLSRMKLDILKLDMGFIRNETAKHASQSILNDVVNMAHRMHLRVVAEGVETREQMQRLQADGCDYVQGYLFAKPMPVAEFETLWMAQCRQRQAPVWESSKETSGIPCLLVADEDAVFCEEVRKTFEGDYRIIGVSDAPGAISTLKESGQNGICAVLLSMTLPENGASRILKAMHEDPLYWEIPVLATIPDGGQACELPLAQAADDFLCKCHPLFDLKKRVRRLIDVAASRRRESALQEEAHRDYLTGLLNRRGFRDAMGSLRAQDLPLAVCLFDLDDLKKINDTCGHDAGDRILLAFADLLRANTGKEDVLCRYGGDEFTVIFKNIADEKAAMEKATEICRLFRNSLGDGQTAASCSAGVALCTTAETPPNVLIEQADEALYLAKRENRGGCCICGRSAEKI